MLKNKTKNVISLISQEKVNFLCIYSGSTKAKYQ